MKLLKKFIFGCLYLLVVFVFFMKQKTRQALLRNETKDLKLVVYWDPSSSQGDEDGCGLHHLEAMSHSQPANSKASVAFHGFPRFCQPSIWQVDKSILISSKHNPNLKWDLFWGDFGW